MRNDTPRLLLAAALALGCSSTFGTDPVQKPTLLAASEQAVTVGAPLEFFGANFVFTKEAHTELRFVGTFTATDGTPYAVDHRLRPHWLDGNRLVWAQVGPFRNPFTNTHDLGTFEGEVRAINVDGTGAEVESDPMPYALALEASLIVRDLRPVRSGCDRPVERLLGGYAYRVEVEAVGFTPVNFTYAIAGETKYDRPRIYRRAASGQIDSFGDNDELYFEPVPEDEVFYLVNLSVAAMGTDGRERTNSLVFGVHRPIEYIDSGEFKVAEIMPPMPDVGWGCIAGGATGRTVNYSETQTDTRSRQVGVNWGQSWSESEGGTVSLAHSSSDSINVTRSESATEGQTFGWEWDIGASAEGSLFGFAKAGVNTKFGLNGTYSQSYTQGWSVGRTYTATDTESWAFTQSRGYSVNEGGSDFWTVSSSNSSTLGISGQVLPGQFGVFYRQTVRIALPGVIVAYNLCGMPEVVGESNFFDYTWSVDLATGGQCPPFPQSNLPEAACFVPPCVNE